MHGKADNTCLGLGGVERDGERAGEPWRRGALWFRQCRVSVAVVSPRSLSMSHASLGLSVRRQLLFSFTRRCSSGSQISSPVSNRSAPRPAERVTASPRLFFFVDPRRHHDALLTCTTFERRERLFFERMVLVVLLRPSVAAGRDAAAIDMLDIDMTSGWCRRSRISTTRHCVARARPVRRRGPSRENGRVFSRHPSDADGGHLSGHVARVLGVATFRT